MSAVCCEIGIMLPPSIVAATFSHSS